MAWDYAKKIQGLISSSEDETYSEEARANYRAKAEEMMRKYRIAEEEALAQDATAARIISTELLIATYGSQEFFSQYYSMMSQVARHCGVRMENDYRSNWDGKGSAWIAILVGYEGDIRYAEFLSTAIRLMFSTRVDASKNESLSDRLNAYYLRSSGKSRAQVAKELWGSDSKDGKAHGQVQRLYLMECKARGEEALVTGRSTSAKLYRSVYAEQFEYRVGTRLRQARDAADSIGGALEMHGRKDRVDEAFYEKFPARRPKPPAEGNVDVDLPKYVTKEDCPKCSKNATGNCKDHPSFALTVADRRRSYRMNHSPAARAGSIAADQAASQIQISRTTAPNDRRVNSSGGTSSHTGVPIEG